MTPRLFPVVFSILLCTSIATGQEGTTQADKARGPTDLGYWNGPDWSPLRPDATRLGLRFAPGTDQASIRSLLADLQGLAPGQARDVVILEGQTVYVKTAPGTSVATAFDLCERLREEDAVLSASPRLWDQEDPRYLTEEILVRWEEGLSEATIAGWTDGLTQTALLEYSSNPARVYRVPSSTDPLEVANELATSAPVLFATPDFQLYRVLLADTNDTFYGDQWHLESTGQNGASVDADVDAEDAWDITRGDSSVIIAVVDTGVELSHPDLTPNLVQGIDVLEDDNDPSAEDYLFGLITENHSTAVCGVAAAAGNNNRGVTGVAQHCGIMPIRFLSEWILIQPTTQDEADAFNFARLNGASVVNNSWGPSGAVSLPVSTRIAIDDCNQSGRNGLGMVIFFAAGNSGSNNNGNGYATYDGVLCVSASTDHDLLASYSSFGAAVDVCAPSNGGTNGITTTDRLGTTGYSSGDYTDAFGGTSSASPCAAGVMLQIFSANTSLTRGDAIAILQDTAVKIDQAGGNYGADGHSNRYGYGKVNAGAAVAAAAGGSGSCGVSSYCVGAPNSVGGGGVFSSTGSTSVAANDLHLVAGALPPNQFGIFYYGLNQTQVALGNGWRCVGGSTQRLPVVQISSWGDVWVALDITSPPQSSGQITAGSTWNFQFWYRDPGHGAAGYNLTDALSASFCE
jgi:hypothetical protein